MQTFNVVVAFGRSLGADLIGGSLYELPRTEPELEYWEGED